MYYQDDGLVDFIAAVGGRWLVIPLPAFFYMMFPPETTVHTNGSHPQVFKIARLVPEQSPGIAAALSFPPPVISF